MAKKRPAKHDEVMLIPFLDILCSLIGVLILIIVVLCVAQTQRARGRTKEEIQLSQKYQSLVRQQKDLEKEADRRKASATAAEKLRMEREARQRKLEQELADKQQRLVELRKRLALSAEEARTNKDLAARVQKEVEVLIAQIEALQKARPALQTEIDQLKKLLAERQKKPDVKPPGVIVQPAGSGQKQNQRLFFVEAGGAGIVFRKNGKDPVRVAKDSVGADQDYNDFLKAAKEAGNASLVFLIRRDGWWSYLRAAGWAEQSFSLNTTKLPIPGDGVIDLSLFEKP